MYLPLDWVVSKIILASPWKVFCFNSLSPLNFYSRGVCKDPLLITMPPSGKKARLEPPLPLKILATEPLPSPVEFLTPIHWRVSNRYFLELHISLKNASLLVISGVCYLPCTKQDSKFPTSGPSFLYWIPRQPLSCLIMVMLLSFSSQCKTKR